MRSGDVLADRFRIESVAGTGGMGVVYRAFDQEMAKLVAVKVLRGDRHGDVDRFAREARILSEVNDPRIVRYVADGTLVTGDRYLAMEWLDGHDLHQRLRNGRLSAAESVKLCIEISDVLGMLHEKGVLHRDLKPSNVFLVGHDLNQIKLLDFGVAQVEASTRMTGTGTLVGTFGYMAPEQANGTKDIDARVDVFALGCVLFECIAGEPAFDGTHPMAILTKILFGDAPRITERLANVPVELDLLVGRLLAKDRQHRPRNGYAVASVLRALGDISGRATEATVQLPRPVALTDSERRALAVNLVNAPVKETEAD